MGGTAKKGGKEAASARLAHFAPRRRETREIIPRKKKHERRDHGVVPPQQTTPILKGLKVLEPGKRGSAATPAEGKKKDKNEKKRDKPVGEKSVQKNEKTLKGTITVRADHSRRPVDPKKRESVAKKKEKGEETRSALLQFIQEIRKGAGPQPAHAAWRVGTYLVLSQKRRTRR